MKVIITGVNSLKLEPETDSDGALLNDWCDKQAQILSSCYSDGKTHYLNVGFSPIEPAEEKTVWQRIFS